MDFIGKILLSLIFLNNREKILQRQVNRNGESNKQGNNKVYLSSSHKLIHPQPLAFKANLHNAQAIFSMQTNPITKTALTLHWHMSPPPTRPRNCREIIGSCSQICTIPLVIRIRRISYSEDSWIKSSEQSRWIQLIRLTKLIKRSKIRFIPFSIHLLQTHPQKHHIHCYFQHPLHHIHNILNWFILVFFEYKKSIRKAQNYRKLETLIEMKP